MPNIVKHSSGAILFYLTPEEQKVEDTINKNKELEKANENLQERLEKLEKLILAEQDKTAENVSEEPEKDTEEEAKPKRRKSVKKTNE